MADQQLEQIVQRMIDAGESEANIATVIHGYQPPAPEEQGSGGATAAVLAARGVPALASGAARMVANHPAAAQKVIGATASSVAGGIGAAVGGGPGALVGASIRGVTPAQTTIRQVAGRMAGETPAVASNAARALGIQNYAKEVTGLKVAPTDIIPHPNAANALEHYANAQERGILRLYGPSGEVVSGPEAVARIPSRAIPGRLAQAAGKVGKVLGPLSAATAVTDFAQTVEPTRRDIGVMGIGGHPDHVGDQSWDDYAKANPPLLNMLAERIRSLMKGQP